MVLLYVFSSSLSYIVQNCSIFVFALSPSLNPNIKHTLTQPADRISKPNPPPLPSSKTNLPRYSHRHCAPKAPLDHRQNINVCSPPLSHSKQERVSSHLKQTDTGRGGAGNLTSPASLVNSGLTQTLTNYDNPTINPAPPSSSPRNVRSSMQSVVYKGGVSFSFLFLLREREAMGAGGRGAGIEIK